MKSRWVILLLTLVASAQAGQGVEARLVVAGRQNAVYRPYRTAELTIRNDTDQPIGAVGLRSMQGGPTWIVPMVVLRGARARREVVLPAMQPKEAYRIECFADDRPGATVTRPCRAQITWPKEWVTPRLFLDPQAWRSLDVEREQWSDTTKYEVLYFAVLLTISLSGAAIVRNPSLRVLLVLLILAAFGAIMVFEKNIVSGPGLSQIRNEIIAFHGRRTETIHWSNKRCPAGFPPVPVYADLDEMQRDDLRIHAGRKVASFVIRPGLVRLFRRQRVWVE